MQLVDARLRRALVGAIGFALAVSACSASGASPSKATPKAPTACLHALDLADLLLNETAQAQRISSQIFDGSVSFSASAPRLTDLASSQSKMTPDYESAKTACRAAL